MNTDGKDENGLEIKKKKKMVISFKMNPEEKRAYLLWFALACKVQLIHFTFCGTILCELIRY